MDKYVLIHKVLSGVASQAEKDNLDHWISISEANKSEFNDIKLLHENSDDATEHHLTDHFYDGFNKIVHKIHGMNEVRKNRRQQLALLAITLGLCLIAFLSMVFTHDKADEYLTFDDDSMEVVVTALQKEHDIEIDIQSAAILKCKFTGTFYGNEVGKVMRSIAGSLNLEYEKIGAKHFSLGGIGCNTVQN